MDKRRFERVQLPKSASVFAEEEGSRLGPVRALGRGGMLVETCSKFVEGSPHRLTLVEDSERIHCDVIAVQRYATERGIGYEFCSLDIDSAVEIGVILGKYYAEANEE